MSNASALTSDFPPNGSDSPSAANIEGESRLKSVDASSETDVDTDTTEATSPDPHHELRSMSLTEKVRQVWGQALFAVSATEEEVQRVLGRLGGWVEMRPEEARRLASELTVRLTHERNQIEESIDTAVRNALRPFRLPGRKDLAALDSRIAALEERLDALIDEQDEQDDLDS